MKVCQSPWHSASFVLVFFAASLVTGCGAPPAAPKTELAKINKESYEKIKPDMSEKEVEAIFGVPGFAEPKGQVPPDKNVTAPAEAVWKVWAAPSTIDISIHVAFVKDKVVAKTKRGF